MYRKIFSILTLITSLTACATSQKYTTQLNNDVGKTSQQLVAQYGNPTHVKRLANGDEIITFISVNQQVIPSPNYYFNNNFMTEDEMFAPFTYGGNEIPIGNFMGEVITDYCNTKFYLKNNIVTSWQWKGNACVAM
ncbi:MAG: hypothetical protein NC218_05610 [Acetobacter sp.]|nr:hypothetical protein [Acetobacter sp.]